MDSLVECKSDIVLKSPVGAKPAIYKWPLTRLFRGKMINGAVEIVETMRWVAKEFIVFQELIDHLFSEQLDLTSYDCIKSLCDRYNRTIDTVLKSNKKTLAVHNEPSRASQGLLKHIIQQVYNYAVTDPTELNRYSPFSSETYGETNFEFMAQLIEKNQFRPRENDIFIDLGSGVGQLVLQVAGSVACKKCYGIEISSVPAGYAKKMDERFRFWMNWCGKTYSDFELFHGNFFDDKYSEIIKNANYIFVNNYAFKPEVDHELKQRFFDLKDGVQILSSKMFCAQKRRVNQRHLFDIGSIMNVVEIAPEQEKDTVSWTNKPLPYYLHTLDSRRVAFYIEKQRQKNDCQTEEGKLTNCRRTTRRYDSSSDESDDNVLNTSTRRALIEYYNANKISIRAHSLDYNTGKNKNGNSGAENRQKSEEQSLKNTRSRTPKRRVKKSSTQVDTRSTSSCQKSICGRKRHTVAKATEDLADLKLSKLPSQDVSGPDKRDDIGFTKTDFYDLRKRNSRSLGTRPDWVKSFALQLNSPHR